MDHLLLVCQGLLLIVDGPEHKGTQVGVDGMRGA
jgi:hypothetical protein